MAAATSDPIPSAAQFPADAPAVVAVLPDRNVHDVDEEQVFLLRLSAPATAESVEANAYCATRGGGERIPVVMLSDDDRQSMLDLFEERGDSIAVLRCRGRLPASASMTLHWGPGIRTTAGVVLQSEQTLEFQVRRAFEVLVDCLQAFPSGGCLPTSQVSMRFTTGVPRAIALSIRLVAADRTEFTPAVVGFADAPLVNEIYFSPPFPAASTMTITLPNDLVDDAGRSPANAAEFPRPLMIGVPPPFPQPFFVVESKGGARLPILVQNFETLPAGSESAATVHVLPVDLDPTKVPEWITRAENARRPGTYGRVRTEVAGSASIFNNLDPPGQWPLPRPAKPHSEEVVGLVLKRPGFYVAEVDRPAPSDSPSAGKTLHVSAALLVTDLAVHIKWWPAGGLVWVTRLSDGTPVANADVTVDDYCNSGGRLWEGRTGREGTAIVDTALGAPERAANCGARKDHPFIVIARSKGDSSFTLSDWSIRPDLAWVNRLVGLGYRFGGRPLREGATRRPRLPKMEPQPSVRPADTDPDAASPHSTSARVRLGVRQEVSLPGKLRLRVIALNREGKPEPREHILGTLYHLYSAGGSERAKGGFYIWVDVTETKKLPSTCSGLTGDDGTFRCDLAAPTQLGLVVATAESEGSQGEVESASVLLDNLDMQSRLYPGNLTILPERLEWVPGETARIQVRAPFPSATALVTVERNGIVSSFVTGLRGKTSIVKVPISTADIPTALVSALAINRGASPSAQETIKLLGSLDYREGTACIVVAPRGKNSEVNEQKVGAKPEKCSGTWVQTATMLNKVVSNPRYNRLIE